MAFAQLTEAVPFYAGLSLEEIGGRGVRWPVTEAAAQMPAGAVPEGGGDTAGRTQSRPAGRKRKQDGPLRLGTYRSIWASPEVDISPALQFTVAEQQVELSPQDAHRLGIGNGEQVLISQNGTRLTGRAAVRTGSETVGS